MRRHSDVILGNVIGSNIFNILAILGVTVVIKPIEVSARFREIDTPVMLGAALVLLGALFASKQIGRVLGTLLLSAYAVYMEFLFSTGIAG
ncbi:hypothetical protein P1J78_24755 [Psychromarinibacter sp. C21-152]|uniref:Sodium/calcium exchanger membrane region domain-containing protein n=1 Tax=Psychromarinibacter sediminicola TaxID=3033385 RepID=A0AAE3NXH3_9RHOB|nr:hypothetical protein [Psychromarinibacter sediminicola]MDF0603927.1 hypothetical protein [Psychromarinibacter sediminicola]